MEPRRNSVLNYPTCDDKPLWDLFFSAHHFSALAVADELEIFAAIEERGSLGLGEISEMTHLAARASEALMGTLAALGLVTLRENRYYNSEIARNYLLPSGEFYWGGMIRFARNAPRGYSQLMEVLKQDRPTVYGAGKDMWETHEMDPVMARMFTSAMHSDSFPAACGAAIHGDFRGVNNLLDVAGGSGCFCIALAQRFPEMKFTIMELPVVCEVASDYVRKYELENRIRLIGGNMFKDPWPQGHDAILLSNIFHDWDWESCTLLAKKSYNSLPRGGKILLNEMLLSDAKDGPLSALGLYMTMIYATKGQQFTMVELRKLLTEAGFVDISMINSYGYFSLISAKKP